MMLIGSLPGTFLEWPVPFNTHTANLGFLPIEIRPSSVDRMV